MKDHLTEIKPSLQTFMYMDKEIRVIIIRGEPWFVLRDICNILGIQNTSGVIKRLKSEEYQKVNLKILLRSRSNEPITIVTEKGLYSTILRSNKSIGMAFKQWVTSEVLPITRMNMYRDIRMGQLEIVHELTKRLWSYYPLPKYSAPIMEVYQQNTTKISEDDVLYLAIFNKTTRQWIRENPDKHNDDKIILDYATEEELLLYIICEMFNNILRLSQVSLRDRQLQISDFVKAYSIAMDDIFDKMAIKYQNQILVDL